MAPKTVKKPVAKKAPAKKPVAKKAPAKKPVAKKVAAPVVSEVHTCGCGHECKCAHRCGCGFGRFVLKLIVFLVVFAMGYACAKMEPCGKGPKHMPRAQFDNGCLVMESVKCPKFAEKLAAADMNADGCIDVKEYRTVKKQMRPARPARPESAPEMPAPVAE